MKLIYAISLTLLMSVGVNTLYYGSAQARDITSGEVVRVKKLERDMKAMRERIPQTGVSIFQNVSEYNKFVKRFNQFGDALKRYNEFRTKEVLSARKEYLALRQVLVAETARAKAQTDKLGDVQGKLRALEKKLFSRRAPKPLHAPFSEAQARAWVASAVAAKQQALEGIKQLQNIAQNANLEKNNPGTVQQGAPYDRQDLNRLTRFSNKTIQSVDQGQKSTIADLKLQMQSVKMELEYFIKLDPTNPTHRANAFLKEGAPEKAQIFFSDKDKILKSAVYFYKQFGKEPSLAMDALAAKLESARNIYSQGLEIAAGEYKLPEAKSTDAGLLKIANQIMGTKRYGFGEHGPIVLTTEKVVDKERVESEEKFDDIDVSLSGKITLTGTKTTWTYKWKEFKFATPIKDDNGKWYVWWITARNYTSGGMHTPIGQWVSGKASKGSVIRAENFLL